MTRRSGLGRGLDSLIPTDSSGDVRLEADGQLMEIPVSAVIANAQQPRSRFDEEALVSLTDSVRELGVLQPVLVRPVDGGRYELIAGERRWRAARRAGLATIPAVVRSVDQQASLEQAVVENLHREDLNAMEEAAAYQRLIEEFGLKQEQVARRVGKSRSAIANTLRLFQLPASVQRRVADGDLAAGHARALLTIPDRARQEELATRISEEGLSVRQVEQLVRAASSVEVPNDDDPATIPLTDGAVDGGATRERSDANDRPEPGATRLAALLELEDLLGNHLDTKVHVAVGKSKGRVVIEFADLEDLRRIYQVMMRE